MSTINRVNGGTATAVAGAATLNNRFGVVTTEALSTAQDAAYTLTITNAQIAASDMVFASVANGSNSQGTTVVTKVTFAQPGDYVLRCMANDGALDDTREVAVNVTP